MKLKSIKIFEQDENIFTSNGLGIVYPSSCVIKRNLPEMTYSLELECIIDNNGKWKLFETGRIIVAKNQPFRIGIIEHDPISRTMKIYAEHIFFDLQNNFIEDTNIVDKNGSMAINQLLSHTVEPHNFVGTSDITSVNSTRCVRKQVLTALLGDQDNSFINRWGGELDIDGLTFKINKQIGSDKGYKIKYGKNLTGLNYKTNMNLNKMATKIRPVGFDGISLNEKYVISSKINDYPMPIIREIKYENVKWKGSPNFETREDDDSFIYENLSDAQDKLRELAQKEFENGIDLLDVTLDVNFIELSKTEEYKDYKILETIELGDTVTLEYAPLGIYTKQRCVEYELDVLTDRYNSIVLGDCEPNFFNETNKVIGAVADAVISGKLNINGGISDNKIQEIISDMTEIMTNYLSGYVVITNNEILIMDTDNKETAQNVWRFNSAGIAHSSTGYNGTYTVGMTMDGHINGRIISANTIMGESMVANTVTTRELAVELNKKIEDSQTKEQVEQIFAVGEGQLKSFISNTYETKTEVTNKLNDLSDDVDGKLNDKADKSTTYTKQEVNTQISQAQSNILLGVSETYETKTEVTNKLNDLSDNFDGKLSDTIVKMDVMYYLSTSTENLSGGTWSSVAPKWEDGKYMWSKTITTFKNGTTKESTPTCLSGATGKDGKGISMITNYYLASSESNNVTTSTVGWTTTIQNMTSTKRYLWNYEEILYSDNSTITTIPMIIGVHGNNGTNGVNGQDGVGIQSITEYYLISNNSSGITTSTTGWTTAIQTPTSSKKYLWNYEKIQYTNNTEHIGTPRIIGNYAKDGTNGTNGKDGINGINGQDGVSTYFYVRYSANANGSNMTNTPNANSLYMGTCSTTNQTAPTNPSDYQWTLIKGADGKDGVAGVKGSDGKTSYLHIKYSNDGQTFTQNNGEDIGKYIGTYVDFNQTDSTNFNDYTWKKFVGEDGQKGDTGKGISSITEYYAISTSNTTEPTTWNTTVPTMTTTNKYLWNYETIKYTDNSTINTKKRVIGVYGDKGQNGTNGTNGADGKGITSITNYYLASSSSSGVTTSTTGWTTTVQTPTKDKKYLWNYEMIKYTDNSTINTQPCIIGNFAQDGTNGKDGTSITSSDVEYYLSTSSTSLSGGSWNTTAPTWENGKYMWSRVKTTFSSGVTSQSQPVCITGQKGDNGTNGADGRGISSITEEYYLSNSKTTQSGGSWQTTAPTWSNGKYLWTRSKIVYTNPTSTVYTTPICDNSWEAVNEIQVGGRNYIKYGKGDKKDGFFKNFSKVENGYGEHTLTSKKQYTNIDIADGFLLGCRDYEVGKKVVFSYEIMYTKWTFPAGSDRSDFWIGQCYANSSDTSASGQWRPVTQHNLPVVGSGGCELNKWFKVEQVLTIPEQAHSSIGTQSTIQFYNSNDSVEASVTFRIRNVKLEYGNKGTDWSPAPEDLLDTIKEEQTALSTNIYNDLNSVNSALMDIGNTNKITPQIKLNLKNMFNMANATNDKLNSLYDIIGILDAEPFKDDKDTAFTNLKNQMNSLFSNISETTIKPISEIYDLFNDFYVKSTNLEKVLNHFAQEKLNYTYANLEMLKDSIDIAVGRVDIIEGHVEEINKHFTFNTDGLTIYSTDNTSTSNVSLNLDNDQMSFKDGDSIVAYVSSNKLNIENAEVKNEFIIGKFAWKPSPKGGLMLVKRGDL